MINNNFRMKTLLSPELLYTRHRLSYPQIDSLLGTNHKELYQKDIIENFKIIREFIVVTDEFRKMGIRFIPLKGPLLSQRIYGDATFRRYHDLDILIDSKDIPRAYKYLISSGYCPDVELPEDEMGRQNLFNYTKHISFIHPTTRVNIELHWQILDLKDFLGPDFNFIYQDITVNQVFMSREFRVLKNEYDLFYLLFHGSTHKWQRLKWLLDINDYMKNIGFDSLKINSLAQKYKVSKIIPLYNSVAAIYIPKSALFDSKLKIPTILVRICIKHIAAKEVVFTKIDISYSLQGYVFGLLLFSDLGNRIAFLKTRFILFSDSKDIRTTNPLLLFLYRPFGYLIRHLRRGLKPS